MATIAQRQNISKAQTPVSDWDGYMNALAWPPGLSKTDRITLFRHGKKDARRGLVSVNEYGEISSPYCESLVRAANQRITLEWMNCSKRSFDARMQIDQIELRIEELNDRLKDMTVQRDEALDAIRQRHYDGDDVVSDHLANRRQLNRERPVRIRYENELNSLNNELAAAEQEMIPYRYALTRTEEMARSREQLIRADYLWRLSVYAYGASNYMKITPDMINDSALTSEPNKQHDRLFHGSQAKHRDISASQQ